MRFRPLLTVFFPSMSSFSGAAAFQNEEAVLRKMLTETKTIALVGASPKPERPSHYVMKYLLGKGYDVVPINPGLEGKELLGKQVYKSLTSIPKDIPVDMVDIFRNSESVPPIVEEAISIGAKSIWMQVGVVNEKAAELAKDAGMDVVMNTCPKIEIPRLGINGPIQSEL